jgi:hypothetical protein
VHGLAPGPGTMDAMRTLITIGTWVALCGVARGDEPKRLCIERLRYGPRGPSQMAARSLFKHNALLISADDGPPVRITQRNGATLEVPAGAKRWVARLPDGKLYEADRMPSLEVPTCLYYRWLYGHLEVLDLASAHAARRCLDCP